MKYAKMYAALVGAIATALLGVFAADTTVGQVLTVVSVLATTVATWAVTNADDRLDTEPVDVDYGDAELDERGYIESPRVLLVPLAISTVAWALLLVGTYLVAWLVP